MNELCWRFLCAVPATLRTWIFVSSKQKGKPHVKWKRVILSSFTKKKMLAFVFCFFEVDARVSRVSRILGCIFFVSSKFSYECGHSHCHWWCVHTSLVVAVGRLFWFNYLLTIYLSSVTLHKWHGKNIVKHIITTRWGWIFQWNLLQWNVLQLVHTSFFFVFPPIRTSN